jgi:DNA-binding NtrC family response regulator
MIRILFLEDSKDDYEMVARSYEAAGLAVDLSRVESEPFFREALEQEDWDLVLLDYALPRFNGVAALDLAHKIRPEAPAVILSGVIEHDLAAETLKIGAADYVAKDNLERLVPVTQRLLRVNARRKDAMRRFRSTLAELRACATELAEGDAHFAAQRLGRLEQAAANLESLATELVASSRP